MFHIPTSKSMNLKFHGITIKSSISTLMEILGEPSIYSVSTKQTTISWIRELDSADIFSIFAVKYMKEPKSDEIILWNIGGQNKQVTEMVKNELSKLLK